MKITKAIFFVLLFSSISLGVIAQVNGLNVIKVDAETTSYKSHYIKQHDGTWWEVDDSGVKKFHFDEIQRDNESIYLKQINSEKLLRLDIIKKKVYYSEGTTKNLMIMNITNSNSAGIEMDLETWKSSSQIQETGENAVAIHASNAFKKVRFERQRDDTWKLIDESTKKSTKFKAWTYTRSRSISLIQMDRTVPAVYEIDLLRKGVFLTKGSIKKKRVMTINKSFAKLPSKRPEPFQAKSKYYINMLIYCHTPDDPGDEVELFGKLYIKTNNKKSTLFNFDEDHYKYIKKNESFFTKSKTINLLKDLEFGGALIEEDKGGDDDLGTQSMTVSPSDLLAIAKGTKSSPSITFKKSGTVIQVFIQITERPKKIGYSERQQYNIADMESLVQGMYQPEETDYEGMKTFYEDTKSTAGWHNHTKNFLGVKYQVPVRQQHVQGMAITAKGRLIVSHNVGTGKGYLIYADTDAPTRDTTAFKYKNVPEGSHPGAMQSCGKYTAVAGCNDGAFIYVGNGNAGSRLEEMSHLRMSGKRGSVGLVYSSQDDCYYMLTSFTDHYNPAGTMTLYKSSTNYLSDKRCRWVEHSRMTGPISSMATQLFITTDGTLYSLCLWTNDSSMSASVTDYMQLSKFSKDKKSITTLKKMSNFRGTSNLHSKSFRYAADARIENGRLVVSGADRTLDGTFSIRTYTATKDPR